MPWRETDKVIVTFFTTYIRHFQLLFGWRYFGPGVLQPLLKRSGMSGGSVEDGRDSKARNLSFLKEMCIASKSYDVKALTMVQPQQRCQGCGSNKNLLQLHSYPLMTVFAISIVQWRGIFYIFISNSSLFDGSTSKNTSDKKGGNNFLGPLHDDLKVEVA